MKTDRYTKLCLTVIAAALVWLCIRDAAPVVQARTGQEQVAITGVDSRSPLAVKIVAIERGAWVEKPNAFDTVRRSQPWEPLPVQSR
jgi:hypothetical protein